MRRISSQHSNSEHILNEATIGNTAAEPFLLRMSILQCRCVRKIGNVEAVNFFQKGHGSFLVAMSQTTLEKPVEEDLSDDNNNVGGSPPTDLPSLPTKDQTLSSADVDAESRGISSASSPFAPSSAPLSNENGLGRCSLTTQDSGVDETLDETMEEERGRAKYKLCGEVPETEEADYAGWVIEEKANEVFALGSNTACAEPEASPSNLATRPAEDTAANLDTSYPERRGTRLRRRRRRSRISQPLTGRDVESLKATAKHAPSDSDVKASVTPAMQPGAGISRTIAERRLKAEALAAERSRELLANLAAAEATAEAARERARQLREARVQELRKRDEERQRNADERRKALEMARQDRTLTTAGRGAFGVTTPGRSKSLRLRPVNGRAAPTCLPRGFASELDPSDPRYCPYGFGSSCRREVCLTTSQIVKPHNDQDRRNLLTTSFTAEVKRKFQVPDKRMTTSATVNYSRPLGGLDAGRVLAKHELNKKTAIQPKSALAGSRSYPQKITEIRSMRIPPSLSKSTDLSSQEKNNQRTFEKTSLSSGKAHALPTFARQKPTYAANNLKPTRMPVQHRIPTKPSDVRILTAGPLGKSQPRKPTVSSDRPLTSSTTTRDAAEGPLQVTTTGLPLRCITSVRGGTEPSEEEVAEYCARMKEQRRLAQERRAECEADAAAVTDAKETDQRVEQEAMALLMREIAAVTVDEAIEQAIADLKAEAIEAAVMDGEVEQMQQHNSQEREHSPSHLPQQAAFRLETVMQGMSMVPPAGEAITVSPAPTDGNPTVVLRSTQLLNRSFSADGLQPPSENDKNLIESTVAASKDRLNKGIEQMATSVGEKWDKNAQSLALRTLSNVTAEAAEREERKRRLQQVMLRIRTPHGSSASLSAAAEDSGANSPGPNHFFPDSDGAEPGEDHQHHPGDQPLTPTTHRSAIQFKPNALLSVLESGRLPKNSRAAMLLRERIASPTPLTAQMNYDSNTPSPVARSAEHSQNGGPVDLTSDEEAEDEHSSTPIQAPFVRTTDVVAEVGPSQKVEDSAAAGEEVDKAELNVESAFKGETASGGVAPQHGLDEEQDIPLSLSTMGGEHSAVLRHSILIRDPQSKLAQADLQVFNAVGDANPQPAE